jgi:cytosine deaminase
MSAEYDILVREARLRGRDGLFDVAVRDGRVLYIAPRLNGPARIELAADGNLVTESFVNPHLHLCKVYTRQMMDDLAMQAYHGSGMGRAMTAIELAARVKEQYDESWIIENVRMAVALAALNGNSHIRALADVDNKAKLEGVKALLRAREEFKGIVGIQVVAFAQDGLIREPGAADLMRQAMDLGADVVGGIPWIEYTEEESRQHIKEIFDIAGAYDKDVSMLVDDAGDAGLRTTEMWRWRRLNGAGKGGCWLIMRGRWPCMPSLICKSWRLC